jgi:uncharacterized protein
MVGGFRVLEVRHMLVRRALLAGLLILLLFATTTAEKQLEFPKPQGWVNDFAGVVRPDVKQRLAELCSEVDLKAHAQIAIVTIESTERIPIADYASKMFNHWGIGHKEDNRGMLVLLAISDRNWRIATGRGFETLFPDERVAKIGAEMVPDLRQKQYSEALLRATSEIAKIVAADRGVSLSALDQRGESHPPAR